MRVRRSSRNGAPAGATWRRAWATSLRIPKRWRQLLPEDVVERYQRVDRAVVAAVAGCTQQASTQSAAHVAEARHRGLSKFESARWRRCPQRDVARLLGRGCRRSARHACGSTSPASNAAAAGAASPPWSPRSAATRRVAARAGPGRSGHRVVRLVGRVLRGGVGDRGVHGGRLVTSDAHKGLLFHRVFQGASWRCAVPDARLHARPARARSMLRRGRIIARRIPREGRGDRPPCATSPATCCANASRPPMVAEEVNPLRSPTWRSRLPLEAAAHERRVRERANRGSTAQPRLCKCSRPRNRWNAWSGP